MNGKEFGIFSHHYIIIYFYFRFSSDYANLMHIVRSKIVKFAQDCLTLTLCSVIGKVNRINFKRAKETPYNFGKISGSQNLSIRYPKFSSGISE